MNKFLVRFIVCMITFSFLLPTPATHAGSNNKLFSQPDTLQLNQLPEERVYLPIIMNGLPCSKAPTLLEPANGASLDNLIPIFKWRNDDPNATELHLEYAFDADFQQRFTALWSSGTTGVHEFQFPTNFEPATTVYWRGFLKCAEIQSPYSETSSFTPGSGGRILPAPTLISPEDDSLLTVSSPELIWSAVDGAVEYMYHYTPTGQGGYGFIRTTETSATFFCGGLPPNATYDWWVKARNDYAWGEDSVKWQFTTPAETQSLSQEHFSPIIYVDQDGKVIKSE